MVASLSSSSRCKSAAKALTRREANKRGFGLGSDKTIQIVIDGDDDLACYLRELFPEALHSLDVAHALEYLCKAAACFYREGSDEVSAWVAQQKERLYSGNIHETILEGDEQGRRLKSRAKRGRLTKILDYLAERVDMMNYEELCAQDLEIGSGAVEGAVRFVISQRFDEGGMRWIRERAEVLLQLRCIELNGHWDQFIAFAHRRLLAESYDSRRPARVLQSAPQLLPKYGLCR